MKKSLNIIVVLLLLSAGIKAQTNDSIIRRNIVGVQYNPFIDNDLFRNSYNKSIIGFKYGYKINNWLMFGSDFMWFTIKTDFMKYNLYNLNFYGKAVYAKYKIKPYAELSGGIVYSHTYVKLLSSTTSTIYSSSTAAVGFNTGLSFNIYKDIISFDLYYKFSNENFISMKKSVISYKLCVNF